MQPLRRRYKKNQDHNVRKRVDARTDDEEEPCIDASTIDAFVPNELNRTALQPTDNNNHYRPANGKSAKPVRQLAEVSHFPEDTNIKQENRNLDERDCDSPEDFRCEISLQELDDSVIDSFTTCLSFYEQHLGTQVVEMSPQTKMDSYQL